MKGERLSNSSQVNFQDIQLLYHTPYVCFSLTLFLPCLRDQTSIHHRYNFCAIKNNQAYVLPSFPTAKDALQNFAGALLMSWRGKCHYPCFIEREI